MDKASPTELPRTQEVDSWQEISEPSSAVVCALNQLIYIFILKWNMNITFSKILYDFTVQLLIFIV